jgi:hypothetical protein
MRRLPWKASCVDTEYELGRDGFGPERTAARNARFRTREVEEDVGPIDGGLRQRPTVRVAESAVDAEKDLRLNRHAGGSEQAADFFAGEQLGTAPVPGA